MKSTVIAMVIGSSLLLGCPARMALPEGDDTPYAEADRENRVAVIVNDGSKVFVNNKWYDVPNGAIILALKHDEFGNRYFPAQQLTIRYPDGQQSTRALPREEWDTVNFIKLMFLNVPPIYLAGASFDGFDKKDGVAKSAIVLTMIAGVANLLMGLFNNYHYKQQYDFVRTGLPTPTPKPKPDATEQPIPEPTASASSGSLH